MMTYLQPPRYDVPSSWTPPRPADLPSWKEAKRVGLDIETCDPLLSDLGPGVRRGGFIAGVSFAIDGGPANYLPIAHLAGDNMSCEHVLQYLKDQARDFTGEIVGANLPYDLDYLAEQGIVFRRATFRDVITASILVNELYPRNSLNDCLLRFGLEPKSEEGLTRAALAWGVGLTKNDIKANMWKLPARHVAEYAIADVTQPLALLRVLDEQIEAQDLRQIWDLETDVLPITVKIRRRGVRVDLDRLEQIEHWALGEQQEFLDRVHHATGVRIPPADMRKKELIVEALEYLGFKLPLTKTKQPCTDVATLEALDHDVARWLIRASKFHKMRNDFAGAIRRHQVNGRIHATFRQIKGTVDGKDDDNGAAYGRFSCTDPNLQQQYSPEKEPEISAMWRQIYIPEEGSLWAACDYSAQEPRMMVHYAALTKCQGGRQMARRWNNDPRMDLHQGTAGLCRTAFEKLGYTWSDVIKENGCRKPAKIIFLGKCYGMGGAKLCTSLGLPTTIWEAPNGQKVPVAGKEGRELIEQFAEMVPWVNELAEKAENSANKSGYVRTLLGRRCRFPKKSRPERRRKKLIYYDDIHKALNRIIQGGSADQGKQALVNADRAGFYVQVPVHDELDASVASVEEANRLGQVMVDAVQLNVPTVVDVEVGKTWGDSAS